MQLALALETNTTLIQLNLSNNDIGDEFAMQVALALETNKTPTELNLGGHTIGAEGATQGRSDGDRSADDDTMGGDVGGNCGMRVETTDDYRTRVGGGGIVGNTSRASGGVGRSGGTDGGNDEDEAEDMEVERPKGAEVGASGEAGRCGEGGEGSSTPHPQVAPPIPPAPPPRQNKRRCGYGRGRQDAGEGEEGEDNVRGTRREEAGHKAILEPEGR